jgi:hypothetical protein
MKTSVKLVLKTNDDINHSAVVVIKDKNRVTKKELGSGLVSKDKSRELKFTLKKNGFFEVKSTPESGDVIIYSSPDISVSDKENPFNYELTLKSTKPILDDSKALSTLSASMKKLGDDIGATPRDINDAIENIIGSLMVVNETNNIKNIIYSVHPNILGVRKVKLEDINWPDTREEEIIDISGNAAVNVSASFPMIAKFGATFENNKVYNLRWEMKGFGKQAKSEDFDKVPEKLIKALPIEVVEQITAKLNQYPNSKAYYISQFYILKNAELYVKEGKKIHTTGELTTSSVVSINGVFSFENSVEKKKSYGSQVLNFWGNEVSFDLEKEHEVRYADQIGGKQDVGYIDVLKSVDLEKAVTEISTTLFNK